MEETTARNLPEENCLGQRTRAPGRRSHLIRGPTATRPAERGATARPGRVLGRLADRRRAAVAAWLPDNPSHVIGDVGEVFMMTGAAVLGVSILVLLQEATGTGYE
jgi:hypothetical protein